MNTTQNYTKQLLPYDDSRFGDPVLLIRGVHRLPLVLQGLRDDDWIFLVPAYHTRLLSLRL